MCWVVEFLWCFLNATAHATFFNCIFALLLTGIQGLCCCNIMMFCFRNAFSPGITTGFAGFFNLSFFRAGCFLYNLDVTVLYSMTTFPINNCMLWCVILAVNRNTCLILCNCCVSILCFWYFCYITVCTGIFSVYIMIIFVLTVIFKAVIFIFTTFATDSIECCLITIPFDSIIWIIMSFIILIRNCVYR